MKLPCMHHVNVHVAICYLLLIFFQAILVYASTFYSNMGNYKSFGDTKFIPAVTADKMKAFVDCSEAYKKDRQAIDSIWEAIGEKMYSLKPFERQIGFPPEVIKCNNPILIMICMSITLLCIDFTSFVFPKGCHYLLLW